MDELTREYENFLSHDEKQLNETISAIRRLAFLRLAAFISIILCFVYLPKVLPHYYWVVALLLTILLLYWVKVFIKKEKDKKHYSRLIRINQNELLALGEVYEQFDDGDEFTDPAHPYSYDLDLFGEGSFFQFLNRTTTQLGKKTLAEYLKKPILDVAILKDRQDALIELSKYTRWRQYFVAKGQTNDDQDLQFFKQSSASTEDFKRNQLQILIYALPVFSISCLILCIFSIIPWTILLFVAIINSTFLFSYRKTISSYYLRFGNQAKILENYRELLMLIENKEFESKHLKQLKNQLLTHDKKASQILNDLRKVMARFDYRTNLLFALLAEPLFVWDLICIYQLDNWQEKYHASISQWFDVIAKFDALSSLANLNHNHPEWSVPTFETTDFCLSSNELAHPLIKKGKRIGNDFRMNGSGQIMIITGANMAGKSTFLRTIGVNMILAMNGCRVCASWFTMKPIDLYTNMRTTDNLQKDESYFFAELLRLKQMLDLIKSGKSLFIIIDEMLKGTNSKDKLIGSKALTEQLIQLNANGLVATHDLKLTELAETHTKSIVNKCFEVHLGNQDLIFDYKLHDGVTNTMNATYLMKQMGIIS